MLSWHVKDPVIDPQPCKRKTKTNNNKASLKVAGKGTSLKYGPCGSHVFGMVLGLRLDGVSFTIVGSYNPQFLMVRGEGRTLDLQLCVSLLAEMLIYANFLPRSDLYLQCSC